MENQERKALEKEIINISEQVIEAIIEASNKEQKKDETGDKEGKAINLISLLAEKLSILLDGQNEYLSESIRQIIQQKLPDGRILFQIPEFANNLQNLINQGIEKFKSKALVSQEACLEEEKNTREFIHINNEQNEEKPAQSEEQAIEKEPILSSELNKSEISQKENVINQEEKEVEQVAKIEDIEDNEEAVDKIESFLLKNYPNLSFYKNYKFHGISLDYFFPELNLALEKEEGKRKAKSKVWKEYHLSKAGIRLVKINPDLLQDNRRFNRFMRNIL